MITTNSKTKCWRWMAIGGLGLTAGCGDAPSDDKVPEVIERKGAVYDLLEEADEDVHAPADAPRRILEWVVELDANEPLADRSRDEIADLMRPVLVSDGHTYLARKPAFDAADAFLAGEGTEHRVLPRENPDRARGDVAPQETTRFRKIIGEDGRNLEWNTWESPHDAVARLEITTNMGSYTCSGFYIGPWTLVTAAHCLVISDTEIVQRLEVTPGQAGLYEPFGSFDCRLDDTDPSNNFMWSVPAGFRFGQAVELDYAVIDTFPCHAAPRWRSGYLVDADSGTFSLYGYPGDTCPGAPYANTWQCGMTGPAERNDWRIESEHIDSFDGQSGGPWLGTGDILAANHSGYIEYFDLFKCGFDMCRRNFGRRIDGAYDQFIRATAYDY